MKPTRFFILCAFAASLCGCSSQKDSGPSQEYDHMKVSNIFRKDSVVKYAGLYGEFNKDVAEEYVQKANALLNADFYKADYYFKKAITLYPNDRLYIQYANALADKGRYASAEEAYDIATELNPAQPADQYIRIFKTKLLAGHPYMYDVLEKFKAQLFSYELITKEVINDEAIKEKVPTLQLRDFTQSINGIWEIQNDPGASEGASFADYVKQFDPITLPYSATAKELRRFGYVRGYFEGEDYDPATDFSRFEENSLFKTKSYCETDFQHKVKEDEHHIVLIHAADSSADAVPADFRCVWHRLLVFDKNGQLIDSRVIGVHAGETLVTYKIGEDLTVHTETFSRKWKKPFVPHEIDNELISTDKQWSQEYTITETGKIEEVAATP